MVKVQANSQGKIYVSGGNALAAKELGTKSITQNGTYAASSDGLDGYSSVTVTVSSGGTYSLLDRVTDDSNNEIGTVSGFFKDANNIEYAVVCLDAQYRALHGSWCSESQVVTNMSQDGNIVTSNPWSSTMTATQNTQLILDFCSAGGYTSGACTHCRSKSFIIGGVTYYGQLPNVLELTDVVKHYADIETRDTSASSYTNLNFSSRHEIWMSNQRDMTQGWYMVDTGSVGTGNKQNIYFVCPVLEIPNN